MKIGLTPCPYETYILFLIKVLETDKAQTVDLMKYILSYASNPSVSLEKTDYSIELVESSVRNLLSELAKVIKMKTGDWICPRYVIAFVCINEEALKFKPIHCSLFGI